MVKNTCANSGTLRNKICNENWKCPKKILVEQFYAHALEVLPPKTFHRREIEIEVPIKIAIPI